MISQSFDIDWKTTKENLFYLFPFSFSRLVYSLSTLLFSHAACLGHHPGGGHPESPERLERAMERLKEPEFARLLRRHAPRIDARQLERVHDLDYVRRIIQTVPREVSTGPVELDGDTRLSPGSGEAALRAAGAVIAAVDAVMAGEGDNAFCAVRPPGHHAGPAQAMGFCFFNNVALGAAHARAAHGLERVAIIDFDVHHGNGTQAIFKREASVFFASTHQWLIFPKTGADTETGVGNIVNVPLSRGMNGERYRALFAERVLPPLIDFEPEFVFISAGFDAHIGDPLGGLKLVDADLNWATRELMAVADRFAGGKLVSALEGGYDPRTLAASVASHVRTLMAA